MLRGAERALWGLALILGCSDKPPADGDGPDTQAGTDSGGADSAEPGWSDTIAVRVTDPDGAPLGDVWVMMGGWSAPDWALTDAEGAATIPHVDDGLSDLFVLAGKEGWHSAGEWLIMVPVNSLIELSLKPLPAEDNPDYHFQMGGDGSSPDTSQCGHCHWTIGDDWAGSAHAAAASNPRTWDLYTGSLAEVDEAACGSLGGWLAEGQAQGEDGVLSTRCYTGEGVLPWLNTGCGGEGEAACDHPDSRASLTALGSCGDCHTPATDGTEPGHIDMAGAFGVASEGVTCDFCHKVQQVVAGPEPGLDGGIALLRPSRDSTIPGQDFEPITFGPYPDVIVPIMNGSYAPQFSESSWCAGCHEYAQPALHPDQEIDESRWPEGLPVHQTWSEYQVWTGGSEDAMTCQDCHMQALLEESSTYDITTTGLTPSLDQGWLREAGQVRHHDFPATGAMSAPGLELVLAEEGGSLVATVTVKNQWAGHAVPSGEPMGQLMVLVTATDGAGTPVLPAGGQVIPDIGGSLAVRTLGEDIAIDGTALSAPGASLDGATVVRIARPTGEWVDYAGPGVGWFSETGTSAEDKGLPDLDFIAELQVDSTAGDSVILAAAPGVLEDGDLVFIGRTDHAAGAPGWLFAKTMADAEGRRGVAHYRAVEIASDNRIAPRGEGVSQHGFAMPADGESLTVTATLIKRPYPSALADRYGWPVSDLVLRTVEQAYTP
jgi:hypothetical protein